MPAASDTPDEPSKPAAATRRTGRSQAFRDFIASRWAPYVGDHRPRLDGAEAAAGRRERLSAAFAGQRLVIPAGTLKIRSNDTDYRFRAHSAFTYLTALGVDAEPDAVLILEPSSAGHEATLFVRPRAERDTDEFYANARYGELWVGPRPTMAQSEAMTGLTCRHLDDAPAAITAGVGSGEGPVVRIIPDADDGLRALLDEQRQQVIEAYVTKYEEEKAAQEKEEQERAQAKKEREQSDQEKAGAANGKTANEETTAEANIADETAVAEIGGETGGNVAGNDATDQNGPRSTGNEDTAADASSNVAKVTTEADEKSEAEAENTEPDPAKIQRDALAGIDGRLAQVLSEHRFVKDDWEIAQLRRAIEITIAGFTDIARSLPQAMASPRGERVVETVFEQRAREYGNGVGYDTIAASGTHACILHWMDNNGLVKDGDLLLVDAGVEVESFYTADLTRTMPVNGIFSATQREVYEAVVGAADAAMAIIKPGITFRAVNDAAMEYLTTWLHGRGLLPGTVEESLHADGQFHRRWAIHGVSHHLGLDVHDCNHARNDLYIDGTLAPGMVFTIEPGLYFQSDDEMVPPQLRGIGVRVEDNVLVTADGYENLSRDLPRTATDMEHWLTQRRGEAR